MSTAIPATTMVPADAKRDFRRMLGLIPVAGVLMVIGALIYLSLTAMLTTAMVLATIGGVFLSVLLGCGLFAAAFFSDKSGHDDAVTRASNTSGPGSPGGCRDLAFEATGPDADEIAACVSRGFCSRC